MRLKFLLVALLALPLLVAALVYGRNLTRCHYTDAASATEADSDKSNCCPPGDSECCPQEEKADAPKQSPVQGNDPDKQIVFKVDGLRCPAVKGIGCGHMLRPVLASVDKIDGVQESSANYTGTMIRVSVTRANDRAKVTEAVRKVLDENKPVALAGDDFQLALEREQWRETWRVGELSAIEFHVLALHRVKTFAKAERLDNEATDKLVKLAEQQWERISKGAKSDGATKRMFGERLRSKGDLSEDNIEIAFEAGAEPFIPFKVDSTEHGDGLWDKMFHYYQTRREEFLQHYHKRSHVEATFNIIKAKFRDHVRSRSDTAMKNEVLCKVLCHNICCVIQSHCELGIEPVFWPAEKPQHAG